MVLRIMLPCSLTGSCQLSGEAFHILKMEAIGFSEALVIAAELHDVKSEKGTADSIVSDK